MLPKNTLRRERLKLLRIFAGPQVSFFFFVTGFYLIFLPFSIYFLFTHFRGAAGIIFFETGCFHAYLFFVVGFVFLKHARVLALPSIPSNI